jgi:CRISPR-associated protein Cas8b1/Cst1 subtype I-B
MQEKLLLELDSYKEERMILEKRIDRLNRLVDEIDKKLYKTVKDDIIRYLGITEKDWIIVSMEFGTNNIDRVAYLVIYNISPDTDKNLDSNIRRYNAEHAVKIVNRFDNRITYETAKNLGKIQYYSLELYPKITSTQINHNDMPDYVISSAQDSINYER